MFEVTITKETLKNLVMLADWQLKELGFDPASINKAYDEMGPDNTQTKPVYFPT